MLEEALHDPFTLSFLSGMGGREEGWRKREEVTRVKEMWKEVRKGEAGKYGGRWEGER